MSTYFTPKRVIYDRAFDEKFHLPLFFRDIATRIINQSQIIAIFQRKIPMQDYKDYNIKLYYNINILTGLIR